MAEFAINSRVSSSTKYAPFELSRGYMPSMIKTLPEGHQGSPGIKAFTLQALQNMAHAHDAIIESRVFQRHWANRRRREEPKIEADDLVYLSTKNPSLPKGRARKLMPRFIGPYKVKQAWHETSNYELDLPDELVKRRIHPRFHVDLLRAHQPNDDALFPDRRTVDAYDFGAPEDAEWYMDEIVGHRWHGRRIEFQVRWSLGDTTWENLATCDELEALDKYLEVMGITDWRELARRA